MNDNLSMNNILVNPKEGFNRGNMFDNLFVPYKFIADIRPKDKRSELLMNIQVYSFAAHEMNLYLDLYPDDIQAIGLFNQYTDEANRLTLEYEREFGKICLDINNNYTWDWVKSPWPWERM